LRLVGSGGDGEQHEEDQERRCFLCHL
jgi:hypothetical protein